VSPTSPVSNKATPPNLAGQADSAFEHGQGSSAVANRSEPLRPGRQADQRPEGSGGASSPPPILTSSANDQAPLSRSAAAASGACTPQRMDAHEKENRRLRIENAELKKRLRFESEFMHKQIRRLRIENAELKKRAFFTSRHLVDGGVLSEVSVQPVWVSASAAMLAPVVANPGGGHNNLQATDTAPAGTCMTTMAALGTTMPASGQMSPVQGTITPIQPGFCLLPWTPGVLTPTGPQWPMGQLVAVPLGAPGAAALVSPSYSDLSRQERLLPSSLLASDLPSAMVSETMSPDYHPGEVRDAAASADASAQFQGPDDRWVCIPSGIVERHKSQFEAPGTADGSTDACNAAKHGGASATGSDATPRMELIRESSTCSLRYDDACQTSNASTGGSDIDAVHTVPSTVERTVIWTHNEQVVSAHCSRLDMAEGESRARAQSL